MKNRLSQLGPWLLAATVLTVPLNLFVSFGRSQAYIHGLLSDYLLAKWYLSDFFIWAVICLGGLVTWQKTLLRGPFFKQLVSVAALMFLLVVQSNSRPNVSSWWTGLSWLSFCWLVIVNLQPPVRTWWQTPVLKKSLQLALVFQATVLYFQWFAQRSLLPYHWLGESNLHQGFGLATTVWQGRELVLPYGTTPHPNVAAGLLVGYAVWWWLLARPVSIKKVLGWGAFLGGAVFLTQSLSAWLAAGLAISAGIGLQSSTKLSVKSQRFLSKLIMIGYGLTIGLWLLTPMIVQQANFAWPNQTSLSRRVALGTAAWQTWQMQPMTGVGLNQSVKAGEVRLRNHEVVRFNQPAHHIGLLWLSETGLIGISMLGLGLWQLSRWWKNAAQIQRLQLLMATVWLWPIAALDHYLLSLHLGLWLLTTSWLLGAIKLESPRAT